MCRRHWDMLIKQCWTIATLKEHISLLIFRAVTTQTHFYASSVIIRPIQFQTTWIAFLQIFWLYSPGVFIWLLPYFQSWLLNPVKRNLRGEKTTNNEPSKEPVPYAAKLSTDNRNFTVFAEPSGMYFTYFPWSTWEHASPYLVHIC